MVINPILNIQQISGSDISLFRLNSSLQGKTKVIIDTNQGLLLNSPIKIIAKGYDQNPIIPAKGISLFDAKAGKSIYNIFFNIPFNGTSNGYIQQGYASLNENENLSINEIEQVPVNSFPFSKIIAGADLYKSSSPIGKYGLVSIPIDGIDISAGDTIKIVSNNHKYTGYYKIWQVSRRATDSFNVANLYLPELFYRGDDFSGGYISITKKSALRIDSENQIIPLVSMEFSEVFEQDGASWIKMFYPSLFVPNDYVSIVSKTGKYNGNYKITEGLSYPQHGYSIRKIEGMPFNGTDSGIMYHRKVLSSSNTQVNNPEAINPETKQTVEDLAAKISSTTIKLIVDFTPELCVLLSTTVLEDYLKFFKSGIITTVGNLRDLFQRSIDNINAELNSRKSPTSFLDKNKTPLVLKTSQVAPQTNSDTTDTIVSKIDTAVENPVIETLTGTPTVGTNKSPVSYTQDQQQVVNNPITTTNQPIKDQPTQNQTELPVLKIIGLVIIAILAFKLFK